MTYNWNNMVDITVPTGTNGWLYSGEVIINGIKVRFPVGTPTSVPEPAAVLLNKMIELEQEEDANTAKPQNHYVGDVTIPAGKTLTLEKGAKLVDNSSPSEVVILPETELGKEEVAPGESGLYGLKTPLENVPADGGAYKLMWGGVEYTSTAVDVSSVMGEPAGTMFIMGNSDISEMTEAIGTNPAPDVPFVVGLYPNGQDLGTGLIYLFMQSVGITPEPPVLSIVQTEGAASSGGASGDFILIVDANLSTTQRWSDLSAAVQSKRNVRMELKSGLAYVVLWPLMYGVSGAQGEFLFYTPGTMFDSPERYRVMPGEDDSITIIKAGTD